jgi:uncharacterized damage-inducible protein DinB
MNGMDLTMQHLLQNLSETYNGSPWHGNSLKTMLKEVDTKTAFYRPFVGKHNIAELVAHILVWRQFVIEILEGNYDFNLDIGALADFPKVAETEKIWLELQTQLDENQAQLLDKLTTFPVAKLDDFIPQKPFTFRFLLEGIVYHDVYHGGQIGYLKAAYFDQFSTQESMLKKATFL